MPPTFPSSIQNKSKNYKKVLIIVVVVLAVVTVAALTVIFLSSLNSKSSQVKKELERIVSFMDSKRQETGGYPVSITSLDGNVKITGGGSFDGTSYCVSGVNKSDASVAYFVDSSASTRNPQKGSCAESSSLTIPSIPGGLAVAFVTSKEIKVSWMTSPRAKEYVLECSLNKDFSDNLSISTSDTFGICSDLKPHKLYYYRVKSTNQVGDSDWSAVQKISTF